LGIVGSRFRLEREFMDTATTERRIEAARVLARAMPPGIAAPFLEHLQRAQDAATEQGRKQRQLEIENSL
jgi:hypothetical protein